MITNSPLSIASFGVVMAINHYGGAYMNTESWLMTLGGIGILDIFVLLKAEQGYNP